MFDRTYVQAGPSSLNVRVDEHRAPTDDSVRLLKEMESAAQAKVVEALRITSSKVEAVIHRYDSPMDQRTYFKIVYSVNGDKRECQLDVEDRSDIYSQLDAIWKRLAEDLAAYLVGGLAKTVARR